MKKNTQSRVTLTQSLRKIRRVASKDNERRVANCEKIAVPSIASAQDQTVYYNASIDIQEEGNAESLGSCP